MRLLGHTHLKGTGLLLQPGKILVTGAGVHHHAEKVVANEIDDEIVDHPAVLFQHAAVQRLAAVLQPVDIVCQQVTQEFAGARAGKVDHRHVRDIEHAGVIADVVVFLDL